MCQCKRTTDSDRARAVLRRALDGCTDARVQLGRENYDLRALAARQARRIAALEAQVARLRSAVTMRIVAALA